MQVVVTNYNCVVVLLTMLFEHSLMRSHGAIFEAVVFGRHCVDKDGKPLEEAEAGLDWVGDARDRRNANIEAK